MQLVVGLLASSLVALPAAWLVTRSSVFADTSLAAKLVTFIATLSPVECAAVAMALAARLAQLGEPPAPAPTGKLLTARQALSYPSRTAPHAIPQSSTGLTIS